MTHQHDSYFARHLSGLKLACAVYVAGIPISHFSLPHQWVWPIAAFFLFAMLFTYPIAAWATPNKRLELAVSLGLAALGVVGLMTSPWLIVAGIFGHGCWDLLKHNGHGVPFYRWYVTGCVVVDWLYALSLALFLLIGA